MREAAEDAETEKFNSAIEAASGDEGMLYTLALFPTHSNPHPADALQVGKIKNKVLKLTGEVQALKIKVCLTPSSSHVPTMLTLFPRSRRPAATPPTSRTSSPRSRRSSTRTSRRIRSRQVLLRNQWFRTPSTLGPAWALVLTGSYVSGYLGQYHFPFAICA